MNNEDLLFIQKINQMAKTKKGLKELIYSQELTKKIIELHDKHGRKALFMAIDKVKTGLLDD